MKHIIKKKQMNTIYLFVGGHAFVTCIGYVVFAENLLTGITPHWKKVWNYRENAKHQDPIWRTCRRLLCILLTTNIWLFNVEAASNYNNLCPSLCSTYFLTASNTGYDSNRVARLIPLNTHLIVCRSSQSSVHPNLETPFSQHLWTNPDSQKENC